MGRGLHTRAESEAGTGVEDEEHVALLPIGTAPVGVYLLLLLVAPVGVLVLYSFWTPAFFTVVRRFTLENYERVATDGTILALFAKTLGVGLVCAALLVVFGFAMAYAITFKMPRWGPRILVLVTATLLASYLVRIYAWKAILGNRGLLNATLIEIGVIDHELGFLLYGYFAIVLTLVYVYLPFSVLLIYAGLQSIDPRVFEASRDLGADRFRTVRRVTIPQAAPAIRVAFAVSFILTTADYVTPQLVGGLHGQMVGRVISDLFGGGANFPLGAALSVVLVLAMAGGLLLPRAAGAAWRALGRARGARPRTRRARSRRRWGPLDRLVHRFPYTEALTVGMLAFLLLPLAVVIVFSFNAGAVSGLPFNGVTLHWYTDVLTREDFRRVLTTSLTVMAIAVSASLLIGVPAAIALVRRRFRLAAALRGAIFGPVAIPGVVIGVALLTSFVFVEFRLGTLTTAAAHTLLVLPFVVLVVRARLLEMDPGIEEAARDLGSSPRRVFRTVTLPLLLPSLVGAALLSAAISLDDVIVTNFVSGTSPTVPVWILGLMRRTFTPTVNAVAVLILSGSLLLIGTAALVFRRSRAAALSRIVAEGRGG